MDYTNQPLGLRVQTQIPLNVKEYVASEQVLKDLGSGNNLAFTYQKGLIVYCVQEGTRYEWREMQDGDTGLLSTNFTYPNNVVTFGIDYSNKEYNFVRVDIEVPVPQGFQDVLNVDSNLPFGNFINIEQDFLLKSGATGNPYNGLEIRDPSLASSTVPVVRIGNGFGNTSTEFNLNFFPTRATFRDSLNLRGLEYHGDYEANFLPRTLVTKQFVESQIEAIPPPTGAETKLISGPNNTVSGNGTDATPYQISVPVPDGSETKINNTATTTVTGSGTNASPYLINVNNLGNLLSKEIYITSWATNSQISVATGLAVGSVIQNITVQLENITATNGYTTGDIVNIGAPEALDSGGLDKHGIGWQYKKSVPAVVYILPCAEIHIAPGFISNGSATGDPFIIRDSPDYSKWRLRIVITYTT